MKQKFVNAVSASRRKGEEVRGWTTDGNHPDREHPLKAWSAKYPTNVPVLIGTKHLEKKVIAPELSDLDRMKSELLKAMREVDKRPKSVPKSKLIGHGWGQDAEQTARTYEDVLALLLAKK